MKVEITDRLDLTREQAALIDMHSVVNIMNVLVNELEYLQEVLGKEEPLQPALDAVQQIHRRLRTSDDTGADLRSLLKCEDRVMEVVHAMFEAHPDALDDCSMNIDAAPGQGGSTWAN